MFLSPYSAFFTSGLLAADSRSPSPVLRTNPAPRRGSLPTDAAPTRPVECAAFYAAQQSIRGQKEYRSFLSLDLAESQSMRSASVKRKASRPSRLARVSSLRPLRAPSPMPEIPLPALPKHSQKPSPSPSCPPRLPSIVKSPPIDLVFPQPTPAVLPSLKISRTRGRYSILSQTHTVSTVSTRTKKINRSDALARLEGRKPPVYAPAHARRNFMSMSDDEDDASEDDSCRPKSNDVEESDLFYAFFEPEDLVLPPLSAPPSPPPSPVRFKSASLSKLPSTFSRRLSRRATKDWFPLQSFMDLKSDDESSVTTWSWRGFIDVATPLS